MDGTTMAHRWVDVGMIADVPVRGARVVRVGALEIGVFRTTAGDIYAIDNRCPHKGGPLSEGIVHDSAVTCPLHNWVLDLRTGKARGADEGCVRTYEVDIRDGGRICLKVAA